MGRWIGDFFTPACRKALPERFKKFLATGETHGQEYELVRQGGTTITVELDGVVSRDEEGRFRQTHCIFSNVTERKRAEEQLRSVSRFPTENPNPVLRISSDGTVLYANKASAPLLEVWDRQTGQVVPPDWQALITSVLSSFVNREVEIKCGERVFSCILAPIMNAGYVNVYGRDVTEHKWAEQELRESEERYRSLVEVCPDAIFVTRDDKIVVANKAGLQLFGATKPEQIIGKSPLDFVPPENHAAAREHLRRQTELRAQIPLAEAQFRRLDGKLVTVEVAAAPILDRGGTAFLAVMRDITERKQLENQFRQAQKMDAIGQLAGGVAHDFSNVLAIIMARSELSMHRLTPQDPLWQELDLIRKTGERATALVRQLMAFSRRQMLRPKLLDLNTVVAEMGTMLRRVIGEDIALTTVLEPKPWLAKADPSQIEQVLMNLVVNARDAMPRGGKLTIETANVILDETYCRQHPDARPGPHALLAVSDTGCGMDPSVLPRIFEPFFTTKGLGQGTGLGLSTAYGIIKQSNGNIEVYSEPGKGTTFKIYLPQAVEEAVPASGSDSLPAVGRGTETVLVVEDEEIVGDLVREVLVHHGYTVLQARHGAEALHLCEQHRGSIHLLLTDVTMPEMSGPELAGHAARLRPDMKVLFMSGYTSHAAANHGLLARGAAFIEKPFTPVALMRAVQKALGAAPSPSSGSLMKNGPA
ncbi:MAG: PAS domain S-box protein [Planctomycetota bacterium]|nr:PAS domain S-box protein [Planctomycetota bacterium]